VKCLSAIEFHHIRRDKEQTISDIQKSLKKVKVEIAKCIIVCSNCHREIHAGKIEVHNHTETGVVEELPLLKLISNT
jgi:predicted HNH restriction endonuclease